MADINADELEERTNKLNDDQRRILDELLTAVGDKTASKLYFLDAPGGTG